MRRLLRGPLRGPFFFLLVDTLMDRCAIFVDAGYLFAQASVLLAGKKLPRSEMTLDHPRAVETLSSFALQQTKQPLLRIYWYDGTSSGPTLDHQALAHLPNVKVRLGFVNSAGEQKGVDSLIITDLINLARNRAMSDALLMSGDEDLRLGVQQAQEFGVRVHLIGIKPSRGSQSLTLLQEADTTHEWSASDIGAFLSCKSSSSTSQSSTESSPPSAENEHQLQTIAESVAHTIDENVLATAIDSMRSSNQVPSELDRKLLGRSRSVLGKELDSLEKRLLRKFFKEACERR